MVEVNETNLPINKVDPRKAARGDRLADQYENTIMRGKLPGIEEMTTKLHKKLFTTIFVGTAGAYRSTAGYIVGLGPEIPEYYMIARRMGEFGLEADSRINELRRGFDSTEKILDTAFWIHYQIASIHPFPDGNGRVARRVMNIILTKFGLKPIVLGPRSKSKYLDSLDNVSRTGDLDYLNLFLAKNLYEDYLGIEAGTGLQYQYKIRNYIGKINERFLEQYG
ncbi:hypothetical protein A2125_00140 [Candidatus Woesebacteria bacterium GWB1_43_5]|uniref:Fido domain-containing protein n=1 Tax=Candidatus Woesebacteria bacterium GWB1_43_5 TaxID=1802474 RepID=A0A1F7WSH6_9BACT|nr:MAG: hypothetical protein A2125_00140 [Candidatus Woesebacteria bacterium GWB1_43_5]